MHGAQLPGFSSLSDEAVLIIMAVRKLQLVIYCAYIDFLHLATSGRCNLSGKTRNVAPQKISELTESSKNVSHIAKACVSIGYKRLCTHPGAFIQSLLFPSKYALRCYPCKEGNSISRCFPARMEKPEGEKKMEKRGSMSAYQHPWNESCVASTAIFSGNPKRVTWTSVECNITMVFYVNYWGTISQTMLRWANKLWKWTDAHLMCLRAEYLLDQCIQAVYAASLYLGFGNPQEDGSVNLELQQSRRQTICKQTKIHCIIRLKNKAETEALNKDVLVNNWSNDQLYTFPPLSLLQVPLQHIETMQTVLLIAPFSMNRPWFYLLMTLLFGPLTHCQSNQT